MFDSPEEGGLSDLNQWASVATIVSGLAVLAAAFAFWRSTSSAQARRLRQHRRVILKVLTGAGLADSRVRFKAATAEMYERRVRVGGPSVREELAWLSVLAGGLGRENAYVPVAVPRIVPIPIAFLELDQPYSVFCGDLADAYAAYAAAIRRRWVLRSAGGPMVEDEYRLAMATSRVLRDLASFEPMAGETDCRGSRGQWVGLRVIPDRSGIPRRRRVRLLAWPHMAGSRGATTFAAVGVSHAEFRVRTQRAQTPLAARHGALRGEMVIDKGLSAPNPFEFDGILTRFHGRGFRVETDRRTGRQKLHLCLSETSFFAYEATQTPWGAEAAGADACASRLISLNLLCVDADDRVLLVQRGDLTIYPGMYSGTVTGNCELVEREGHPADLDENGLPDLLGAVAREALEEIGVDLRERLVSDLGALGLIQVDSEWEVGTLVFVATARLPDSSLNFALDPSSIDTDEGAWELGTDGLVIDLRQATESAAAARKFVDWLRTSPDLTPHAVGSLLLLAVARQELRERSDVRRAALGAQGSPASWTAAELAEWLTAPLPDVLPPPTTSADPSFVRRRPLSRTGSWS